MIKAKHAAAAAAVSVALATTGCAELKYAEWSDLGTCAIGGTIGAVGGAIVSGIVGGGDSRYVAGGAVAGAIAGCGINTYLKLREKRIAAEAKEVGFDVEFERISMDDEANTSFSLDSTDDVVASQVSITSEQPLFASGEYTISDPEQLKRLKNLIGIYLNNMDADSQVYIIGHTDSSGSAKFNQKLSEKRALFIAQQFVNSGFDVNRLFLEGVGESQPIADNMTESGKAKNRRFEIIDVMNAVNLEEDKRLDNIMAISAAKKRRLQNVVVHEPEQTVIAKEHVSYKPSSTPVEKPKKSVKPIKDSSRLKLAGVPVDQHDVDFIAMLGVPESSGFFMTKAVASPVLTRCVDSQPVVRSSVIALGDIGDGSYNYKTSEMFPGLNGGTWHVTLPEHSTYVALTKTAILKNTYQTVSDGVLRIYPNYSASNNKFYAYEMQVESYEGSESFLLRMYPKAKSRKVSDFTCADFIFDKTASRKTKLSNLYYTSNNQKFVRDTTLEVLR
ncbi:OmpA family protein [Vibrio sp. WJH972]